MLFIDVFSDCQVIFALLSGTLPFAAKTELDPKSHPSSLWDKHIEPLKRWDIKLVQQFDAR